MKKNYLINSYYKLNDRVTKIIKDDAQILNALIIEYESMTNFL